MATDDQDSGRSLLDLSVSHAELSQLVKDYIQAQAKLGDVREQQWERDRSIVQRRTEFWRDITWKVLLVVLAAGLGFFLHR